MAAEIQNGTAIVYGVSDNGTPITMTGFATFTLGSGKLTHKFDLDRIKDSAKFTKALVAADGHLELELTWTPSGATRAAAAATAVVIAPLAKVTLANFKVVAANGDWVYVGDETIEMGEGAGKISLKLEKYDDVTQNTSLTTTVTG